MFAAVSFMGQQLKGSEATHYKTSSAQVEVGQCELQLWLKISRRSLMKFWHLHTWGPWVTKGSSLWATKHAFGLT